jgi:hypothetical protein
MSWSLAWALTEYDRVFNVGTDVFLVRSPFLWISPSILAYTDDPKHLVATRACANGTCHAGALFFRPDTRVVRRLAQLGDTQQGIPRACEPAVGPQSLLNHAFAASWRGIEPLVRHVRRYQDYNTTDGDAPIVHFAGRARPLEWMAACATDARALRA